MEPGSRGAGELARGGQSFEAENSTYSRTNLLTYAPTHDKAAGGSATRQLAGLLSKRGRFLLLFTFDF